MCDHVIESRPKTECRISVCNIDKAASPVYLVADPGHHALSDWPAIGGTCNLNLNDVVI